jgi:deoxyribodipyrimidine photo-lyase
LLQVIAPVIYWFRQDLRLNDLPALAAAVATGRPVLPCYILDDSSPCEWRMGAASRWWLNASLTALAADISALGGQLRLRCGPAAQVIQDLVKASGACAVYCSRQYEPWARTLEDSLRNELAAADVQFECRPGALLWEPASVANQSGLPFKVFTPFWRHCQRALAPAPASGGPGLKQWYQGAQTSGRPLDFTLHTPSPDRTAAWQTLWRPGERGASARLEAFLQQSGAGYARGRDYPDLNATSRLSAHLHFGEISPNRVYFAVKNLMSEGALGDGDGEKFLGELGWREFSNHLLYHFPEIPEQSFKPAFARFPWVGRPEHFEAWKRGQTGYPIVDAGMRELLATGHMHNRVRMIASSFLCKHLLIDWRAGQRWFWETLVDADLANNSCGWQWVAGSGADAAPYFRIFNPVTQAQRYDPQGSYIRRWVPELSQLPTAFIHQPWKAPASVLETSRLTPGSDYPGPIVDHAAARQAALAAYDETRGQGR